MAVDLAALYLGRVDVSDPTGYPTGAFLNESAPAANDGTPNDSDWANDFNGFFQALIAAGGITISGNPDKVGASDYLDALIALFASINDGRFPTSDEKAALVGTAGSPSVSNKYLTNVDSRIITAAQAAGIAASPTAISALNAAASQADLAGLVGSVLDASKMLHVIDRKASGTVGKAVATSVWTQADLQTTLFNGLGATVSGNAITGLAAGDYWVELWQELDWQINGNGDGKVRLQETVLGPSTLLEGGGNSNSGSFSHGGSPVACGLITLVGGEQLEIEGWINSAIAVARNFGLPITSGDNEIYNGIRIWQV